MSRLKLRKKWNSIRDKIQESSCDIVCLQETKRESFDASYIAQFYGPSFDNFSFLPSRGNSGGIFIAWKSFVFSGQLLFQNDFPISIELISKHNEDSWVLTSVYAPCLAKGKKNFLDWFQSIQMPNFVHWLILGDFNLMRRPEDRNKEGGDIT
jgi:exonuclease III